MRPRGDTNSDHPRQAPAFFPDFSQTFPKHFTSICLLARSWVAVQRGTNKERKVALPLIWQSLQDLGAVGTWEIYADDTSCVAFIKCFDNNQR